MVNMQSPLPIDARPEFRKWLNQWPFSRYVTLAFNQPVGHFLLESNRLRMRERLRKWDAMMNSKILGRNWAKKPEDHMFTFYVLEKPNSNPHYHGLIRFFEGGGLPVASQEERLDKHADRIWKHLVPSGSTSIQAIYDQAGASKYLAKTLANAVSWDNLVLPDEFKRH